MKQETHQAFAQGALFGEDKRVMNQSQLVLDVCKQMPYGYSRKEFMMLAGFLVWFRYPTFPRFMRTMIANYDMLDVQELVAQLSKIKGDFPNPETIQREIRAVLESRPEIAAKCKYKIENVYKKRTFKG